MEGGQMERGKGPSIQLLEHEVQETHKAIVKKWRQFLADDAIAVTQRPCLIHLTISV